jgi:hypothetical protein
MSMNAGTKGEPCLSSAVLLSCSRVYKPLHMNTKSSLPFQMKLRTASVSPGVSNVALSCLYGHVFSQLIVLLLNLTYCGYVTVDGSEGRCSVVFRFKINSGILYRKVTEMPKNSDCKRVPQFCCVLVKWRKASW